MIESFMQQFYMWCFVMFMWWCYVSTKPKPKKQQGGGMGGTFLTALLKALFSKR